MNASGSSVGITAGFVAVAVGSIGGDVMVAGIMTASAAGENTGVGLAIRSGAVVMAGCGGGVAVGVFSGVGVCVGKLTTVGKSAEGMEFV